MARSATTPLPQRLTPPSSPRTLTTYRPSELFEAEGTLDQAETSLRKVMTLDPKASWPPRRLALVLSSKGGEPAWSEAWALVKIDGPVSGDSPEDRLIHATVLKRGPDPVGRAELVAALAALTDDLNPAHPAARASPGPHEADPPGLGRFGRRGRCDRPGARVGRRDRTRQLGPGP